MPDGQGHYKLSCWFGLSYASFVVMPRILMEAMPDAWQGRMTALLTELDDAFPSSPVVTTRVLPLVNGKLARRPEWVLNYRHPDPTEIAKAREHR